jgi:hypothetical protein
MYVLQKLMLRTSAFLLVLAACTLQLLAQSDAGVRPAAERAPVVAFRFDDLPAHGPLAA